MKTNINRLFSIIYYLSACFLLCGCITEYQVTGIDGFSNILVVEGIITDVESNIRLSRSTENLTASIIELQYINNAKVYVECDDGTQRIAENPNPTTPRNGLYLIKTGQLNFERKYRLKIVIFDHEYCSEFTYPIKTPEIDSIFWSKKSIGQPVRIHLTTHSTESENLYCRWLYREDWQIISEYYLEDYPYRCWDRTNNVEILIGSAEKKVFGKVSEIIREIPPSDKILSVLYRIDVKQNAISKKAYDYWNNVKKNSEQIGSIFAPIPSEISGNITCITDRNIPVIGYIDVSTTTQYRRYISRWDGAYEKPTSWCKPIPPEKIPEDDGRYYVYYKDDLWLHIYCVDCTNSARYITKPDDWLY